MNGRPFRFTASHLWVAAAALLNLGGWGLSLIRQLNTRGYSLLVGLIACGILAACLAPSGGAVVLWDRLRSSWRKFAYRLRRPLPCCFFIAVILVFLSGLIHWPNNYDCLSYRIPRVLNWLAENRWHWIHTQDARLNIRACGTEWLMAPWIAVAGTDRWIFAINATAFVLLPGLIWSVFRGLGITGRVAWHWMWLLPSGYCFLLQAGGSANDIVGAFYALAAMSFALRARASGHVAEACFAVIAAALLTGCKSSNLPLLLPIAIALAPSARLLLARPLLTGLVVLVALSVSVVPISGLNWKYCGDWTGYKLEGRAISAGQFGELSPTRLEGDTRVAGQYILMAQNPLIGISGNAVLLVCDNLFPPIVPFAKWWNGHVLGFFPSAYKAKLMQSFMPSYLNFREMAGEETASFGFGLSWLLVLGAIAAHRFARASPPSIHPARPKRGLLDDLLLWSPFVPLLVFMAKNGVTAASRLAAPYYLLLVAPFLISTGYSVVVRKTWWRRACIAVYLLAFAVLVLAPDRPLWPAETILNAIEKRKPQSAAIERAKRVYSVYAQRADAFAPVRELLPPEVHAIGMLAVFDEASTSLWRPFGQRRVRQLLLSDDRGQLDRWGVEYIVARDLGALTEPWLRQIGGEVIARRPVLLFAATEPVNWLIVRVRPASSPPQREVLNQRSW